MNLLDIILLAVALAMDCLAVSVVSGVIGASGSHGYSRPFGWLEVRMAFLFGFFQAAMPLLGWLGMSCFRAQIEAYDHWIAFALLVFIGGNMIRESFGSEELHFNPRSLRTQLLLAVATSIDALAVGISFACIGYGRLAQLAFPLVMIGLVSFVFSVAGVQLGIRFGRAITRRFRPGLLGGVILILIGIKILVSHLFGIG